MKVLILAVNDRACVGYMLAQSLKRVGVDATAVARNPHLFGRKKQAIITKDRKRISNLARKADVIHFHNRYVDTGIDLSLKKVVVFFGGTSYRLEPEKNQDRFNPIVDATIIRSPDFFGLGAKNEKFLLPPIDTDNIRPVYERSMNSKLVVAHYPSHYRKKGTNEIWNALYGVMPERINLQVSTRTVDWEENIRRISLCDVYIDQFAPEQDGRPLGIFGVEALEAAALGKIVITNFHWLDLYKEYYGNCGLWITNSLDDMANRIEEIAKMKDIELLSHKRNSRRWVAHQHSFKRTGKMLKEIYESLS